MGTPANPTVDKFGRAIVAVDYKPAGPAHDVSFLVKNASTPSTLYVERDDSLLMVAATSATGEVVTFNLRVLTADGRIQDMQFTMQPSSTRAPIQLVQALVEGYLLSMSVHAAVATTRGQTFARAMIVRSGTGVAGAAQMLFADYATTLVTSGYPNGRIVSPVEGPGNVYTFQQGAPGAGLDWSAPVPTNARWRVRSLQASLTTSAAVANRDVAIRINQNAATVWLGVATAHVVASSTVGFHATGLTPYTPITAVDLYIPLPPDLVMGSIAGFNGLISSVTTGIQGADQWSGPFILIEEWLDNV